MCSQGEWWFEVQLSRKPNGPYAFPASDSTGLYDSSIHRKSITKKDDGL